MGRRTTPDLDRDACERRVHRLAALLTGEPLAATQVVESVVAARDDLRELDDAHLDRLTVLRSREIRGGSLVADTIPAAAADALAALPTQAREAWIFRHVYRLTPRECAKAMDCSVTAIDRHREQAERQLAAHGGTDLAAALLRYSQTLDLPPFYRARQRRRRAWRRSLRIAAWSLLGLAVLAIVIAVIVAF